MGYVKPAGRHLYPKPTRMYVYKSDGHWSILAESMCCDREWIYEYVSSQNGYKICPPLYLGFLWHPVHLIWGSIKLLHTCMFPIG